MVKSSEKLVRGKLIFQPSRRSHGSKICSSAFPKYLDNFKISKSRYFTIILVYNWLMCVRASVTMGIVISYLFCLLLTAVLFHLSRLISPPVAME